MIKSLRKAYNEAFTEKKYQEFLQTIHDEHNHTPGFRISETPIFIPTAFRDKLVKGCNDIIDVITRPDFLEMTKGAISPKYYVPNESKNTEFLVIDFGVCQDEKGELTPQMIEMQGFPSLYFFQHQLAQAYRQHFGYNIPCDMSHLFGGLETDEEYVQLLREVIVGDVPVENVVLLEVEPEKQNTQVDFWATQKQLGVKVLCLTKVIKEGKKLFYENDKEEKIQIKRIYNRVIFDELDRKPDLKIPFDFTEDLEIEWAGHPNWYFRISKYTLPFIDSEFVPKTYFLKDLKEYPTDLENYVLKPLFSFSGQGVKINITKADLDEVTDRDNYILQRKVQYVPALQTPNPEDPAKIEIRMLLVWKSEWERPKLINNLIRLSKGEMIGVRYNKDKDWVGASVGFFEL